MYIIIGINAYKNQIKHSNFLLIDTIEANLSIIFSLSIPTSSNIE
jgi:hypothetical protein